MNTQVAASTSDRILDSNKQRKPLDFGKAGMCGSVSPSGNLVLLNRYHSKQGFAGLTTSPPFPFADRYDQQAVRRYRRSLVELEGFGPRFEHAVVSQTATLLADAIPQVELHFADGSKATMTVLACESGVVQRWQFSGDSPDWQGSLSLQRAAYTQLTEGGPLPDIAANLAFGFSAGRVTLCDNNLECTVIIDGLPADSPAQEFTTAEPVNFVAAKDARQSVFLSYAIAESSDAALANAEALTQYRDADGFERLLEQEVTLWQGYMEGVPDDLVLRRGLVYGRMLSIPTSDEATCIMTDHMLLPLSWNRDAYFVAIALLQWGQPHWQLVRQHLIWMFEVADRGEDNEWGRCYLVNGRLKDKAYQLDQQLFPLLELADYVFCSGDNKTLARLQQHVQPLVDTILRHRHASAYLFPTDETPGDDPLDYKYHFSSHLLAWHTFNMLEKLLPGSGYQEIADQIHADTQKYFIASNGDGKLYSYATDTQGNHLFYHDANDVPLALAPDWGFVSAEDQVWQATVKFAFTEANTNGYFATDRLGSVHTSAPWPLGDVQKLVIARLLNQADRETQALADLRAAAQWDGGLPEAYDGETLAVKSRNWFAWPNAYYAMAQLNT